MGHIIRLKYSEPHHSYEDPVQLQLDFPPKLEVEKKILLIAAMFLIVSVLVVCAFLD